MRKIEITILFGTYTIRLVASLVPRQNVQIMTLLVSQRSGPQ